MIMIMVMTLVNSAISKHVCLKMAEGSEGYKENVVEMKSTKSSLIQYEKII